MCKSGDSLPLTPNRRLAVSDVVPRGDVPELVRRDPCIAGANRDTNTRPSWFEAISIEPTRVYDVENAHVFLTDKGIAVGDSMGETWARFKAE
jgi:arsenite methyltransferase